MKYWRGLLWAHGRPSSSSHSAAHYLIRFRSSSVAAWIGGPRSLFGGLWPVDWSLIRFTRDAPTPSSCLMPFTEQPCLIRLSTIPLPVSQSWCLNLVDTKLLNWVRNLALSSSPSFFVIACSAVVFSCAWVCFGFLFLVGLRSADPPGEYSAVFSSRTDSIFLL